MPASSRAGGTSGTDVAIGKSANTTSALVGNTVVFTIGFTNFGPTTANNLAGSDVLPSGFSIFAWNSSGTPSAPVYNPTNGAWTIDAIAAGATDLLTISTTATNSGIYTNTALITSAGNVNNNAASVVVTLTPQTADLIVTKTAGLYGGPLTNQFQPGDVAEFTITITNPGPGTAYNIAGSDVLPAGFTFDVWGNAGSGYYPQYNSTNGSWTLYELPPGNWGSFSILASAAAYGIFTNTAAITSAIDLDPNPNNNTASVIVTVNPPFNPQADLSVTKTGSPASVTVGQNITYSIVVSNAGPNTASNVISRDSIPTGTVFVSATPPGYTYYPNFLRVDTAPFDLAAGSVFTWTVTVQATNAQQIVNAANANGDTPDPNTANNVGWATNTAVNPQADVSVTKNGTPASVTVGQNITYSIVVSNAGPNTASNVISRDSIPTGTVFVSATPPGYTYYPNFLRVDTAPFDLAAGSVFTWTVTVQATNAQQIVNAANANGDTPDPNTANNVGWATNTAVNPQADVSVTKNGTPASVTVGQNITYSIVVSNAGPNTASNVISRDSIPTGTVFVSATPPGYTYYPNFLRVDTAPFDLAAGSVFTWTVTVQATNAQQIVNAANANGDTPDPNTANNVGWATNTAVNPQADVSVTKNGTPASVTVGQNITYSIVVSNAGPNTASNVISRDSIPTGTVFVSATPPGYTYYPNFLRVDTAPFDLAAGSVFTWTVTVQATNAQQIVNAANANGDTPDPNTANNVGWATNTAVNPQADLSVTKTPDKNSIAVSNLVNFTIVVSNAGPTSVTNVQVPDVLGAGWSFVGAINGGNVNFDFPSKTFTILSLNNGASVTMIYQALAIATGQLTNTVQVLVPPGMTDPNLTNNNANAVVTSYPVYNLSGYVRGCQTNGPPIPYVNVTLTGGVGGSTLTDTNGFYTFANLRGGSYTVTPSQPGNIFGPTSFTLTLSSNTTLAAFAGSIGAIRGRVNYGTNGAGVPGIYIQLTGGQSRTVLTDPNGVYSFSNTPPGNYVVTPVATNGFIFAPTNTAITISGTKCTGQANFSTQARTVLLVALEVNQAIQDWSNSVPLVQNKETVLRAFLQLPNATNPPVLLQGAKLYATGAGGMLAGSPQTPMNSNGVYLVQTTNAAAGRSNFVNSLNFRLPAAWLAGTINLQLVCTDNVTVIPTNVVPANSTVQVTFAPVAAPQVKFYGVNWTNRTGTSQSISGATMQNMIDRMKATYPVARVDVQYSTLGPLSQSSLRGTNSVFGDGTTNAYPNLGKVNSALVLLRALDSLFLPVGNRIYYGAIAGLDYVAMQPGGFTVGSATAIPGPAASGFSPANPYGAAGYNNGLGRHTHSHEIGHDLGLQHDVSGPLFGYSTYIRVAGRWVLTNTAALSTNSIGANGACGEIGATNSVYPLFQMLPNGAIAPALGPLNLGVNALVFGVDTLTLDTTNLEPVLSPYQYFDLMSYCRGGLEDRWAGVFTYQTLLGIINGNFTVPPQLPPLGQLRRWLFIRGRIDPVNDVAEFAPFVAIDSAATPPGPPAGDYMLILRDANGNVLNTISFEPEQGVDDDSADQPAEDQFLIPVPIDPESQPVPIREVQISDGVNILSDIVASTNFPAVNSVTLSATNGGPFTGSGLLNISWLAVDADPNAQLTYIVQYSSVGGTNWQTLGADLTDPAYSVDSQYLKATTQGQVRVIASDGFDSSDPAYSSIFQVANHAPVVTLNAPMNGGLYIGNQQVFLTASVDDLQDGPLDDASVQWSSSIDGILGSGDTLVLQADELTEGIHVITVTATDSLGLTNSASVTIYVLSQSPPALAIQSTDNQVLLSWPASVTNYLLETSTSLMPASWSTVTNLPVAADITQTVTLNLSNTNRFFRLRLP